MGEVESPAGAVTESAPGPAVDAPASAPEPVQKPGETAIERAFAKAQASLSAAAVPAAGEPAAAVDAGAASAPVVDAGAAGVDAAATPSAAPVAAGVPAGLAAEKAAQFQALPDDAKPLVAAIHADMAAEVQRSKAEHQAAAQAAAEYQQLRTQAQADPQTFLLEMARSLGVDLAATVAAAEPPEFATTAELAKWAADQATRGAERTMQTLRAQAEREAQTARAKAAFEAELSEARKAPEFAAVEPQVIKAIIDSQAVLSVADAFGLLQLPTLRAQAARVPQLEAEVQRLQAADEARRKGLATMPAARTPAESGRPNHTPPPSRYERALQTAQRRLARA